MFLDKTGEYPWDLVKKAWELGLINNHIPADIGGTEINVLTSCIIAEEMAWGCTGIQTALEATGLGQTPVILSGNEAQKVSTSSICSRNSINNAILKWFALEKIFGTLA